MKSFTTLIILFMLSVAHATPIKQYASIPEMMKAYNDYGEESFKMLATQPVPHLRINSPVLGESKELIEEGVQRVAVYGIYRVFLHTDNNQIKVTSVPAVSNLKEYGVTLQLKREQVLEVAKRLFGVNTLEELVKPMPPELDFQIWTDTFNRGYYNDQGPPTLRVHFAELLKVAQQTVGKVQDDNQKETKFSCKVEKRRCSEMASCEEAKFYLNECGVHRLDGNSDGVPCETICK